jgi:hypothetical protein
MHPEDQLAPSGELARYQEHEAGAGNAGHRTFLRRLVDPLVERLIEAGRLDRGADEGGAQDQVGSPGQDGAQALADPPRLPTTARPLEGLDFGSGPVPVLSSLLEAAGIRMQHWDPFFAPDPAPLQQRYDLVTLTEVIEHLRDPAGTLDQLADLVLPGGWIAGMTDLFPDDYPLERWYYLRDPTHVSLYRQRSMAWIADARGWTLSWLDPRVFLFQVPLDRPDPYR